MKKIIKINESQLQRIINKSLNESFISDTELISYSLFNAILNGGILYDKDCPEIGENVPTLVSNDGNYTVYLIGTTDSMPEASESDNRDYYTPPSGGEIKWSPRIFYVKDVYSIVNNKSQEEIDDKIFNILREKILKNITKVPISNKYEIIINTEEIEDFDPSDIEYDNYRDKQFN